LSSKKTVFLTGASGNMGQAALPFFVAKRDELELRALVLDTPADRARMTPYIKRGEVKVHWGDLTNYQDVLQCTNGADYVLHVGGMVSPVADHHPELTTKVNVEGARNIVRAIQAQPDPDRVKLVYIGSVAQTGNRMAPIHWGRVGDPIKVSAFDNYAVSKTIAEQIVVESRLKHWVSLRQTAIAHRNLWRVRDPIIFHNPLRTVFEWVTANDSGRLLANLCEDTVDEQLWRKIYNIGGGEKCRVTNDEFYRKVFAALGIRDYQEVFDPQWFALRNFHGQWYADSDRLQQLVPYRAETLDDFARELAAAVPGYYKLGGLVPSIVKLVNRSMAHGDGGTMRWILSGDSSHIEPYFGSRQAWERIGGWDSVDLQRPTDVQTLVELGYDEALAAEGLSHSMLCEAARFRGGECRTSDWARGEWHTQASWRCGAGHEFSASPTLILRGGHWCPVCTLDSSQYPTLAKQSAFFRQVWEPDQALVALH
jgi:nucleoside-diphosphate-sugar epimerase